MERKKFSEYDRGEYDVWIQRASHGKHNLFEEHLHDFVELIYVVQGQGMHRINGMNYALNTGDVFLIMPGESHHFPDAPNSHLEIVNCLFRQETIPAYLPKGLNVLADLPFIRPFCGSSERPPRKLSLTSAESTEVLGQLEAMLQELKTGAPGANVIAVQLLVHLLIRLSRILLRQSPDISRTKPVPIQHEILVRKVIAYLEQHFHRKLSIEELARAFTISGRHLCRVFREQTNRSIHETLLQIRVERAKQMLAETNRSVDSIASFAGFSDSSHFNRTFIRLAGCTPSRYRKECLWKTIY
jgi:AraC-like DNA-binding protein